MHYLLYSPSWYYHYQKYKDEYNVDYELTIQPLYCNYPNTEGINISANCVSSGSQVTVKNKRADRFTIEAGKSLTITDVKFDSLDSNLSPLDSTALTCLNSRVNCCRIADDGTITKESISTASL